MGLAASWDHWVTDSIPGLAQWVKDLALPQLWLRLRQTLGSDPWPQNSYAAGKPKIKKKKYLRMCGQKTGKSYLVSKVRDGWVP